MLATLVALSTAACGDSTDPGGFTTDELTTELAVTPDHIHAFQTTVTFTVAVTDPDGNPVTDFDLVQVETRPTGTTEAYEVEEATSDGDFYAVDVVFEGSGEYDVLVTGLRPSDTELVVLDEEASPLEVVRAHEDVSGYKVEFEPDPGHIHEGESATVRFWILDDETDDPFTGLTPEIFVVEPVSGETAYAATEGADGLYYADHTFDEAGENEMGIRISAADALDGVAGEFSIAVEIHEPH
jgi:hypothetical protein